MAWTEDAPARQRPGKVAIMRAAVAVIGEVGYDAASVRDMAARAGVSVAALYYHFPSKSDLLREFLDEAWEVSLARLQRQLRLAGDDPVRPARHARGDDHRRQHPRRLRQAGVQRRPARLPAARSARAGGHRQEAPARAGHDREGPRRRRRAGRLHDRRPGDHRPGDPHPDQLPRQVALRQGPRQGRTSSPSSNRWPGPWRRRSKSVLVRILVAPATRIRTETVSSRCSRGCRRRRRWRRR